MMTMQSLTTDHIHTTITLHFSVFNNSLYPYLNKKLIYMKSQNVGRESHQQRGQHQTGPFYLCFIIVIPTMYIKNKLTSEILQWIHIFQTWICLLETDKQLVHCLYSIPRNITITTSFLCNFNAFALKGHTVE